MPAAPLRALPAIECAAECAARCDARLSDGYGRSHIPIASVRECAASVRNGERYAVGASVRSVRPPYRGPHSARSRGTRCPSHTRPCGGLVLRRATDVAGVPVVWNAYIPRQVSPPGGRCPPLSKSGGVGCMGCEGLEGMGAGCKGSHLPAFYGSTNSANPKGGCLSLWGRNARAGAVIL